MHAYCFPIQVATGETSAMQKLALGTRIILEHGTAAVVSGDAANAYNSLERASLLRFLASPEAEEAGLLPLLPAAHAQLSLATQCTDRGALLPVQLRRGLPQGDPWSTDLFCLGVHYAFKRLDEELRGTRPLPAGAPPMPPVDPAAPPPVFVGVRAFADDNHIYCAPEHGQWALDRLGDLLRPLLSTPHFTTGPPAPSSHTADCTRAGGRRGLIAGGAKHWRLDTTSDRPSGRVVAGSEAAVARGVLVARGMEVAGVPEGEPGYVQARMTARLDEAESNAKLLREILCTVGHRHQALCLLRYCVAPSSTTSPRAATRRTANGSSSGSTASSSSSTASSPASHSHPPPRRRQPQRNAG